MNIIKWLDVAHDFVHELFVNPGFKTLYKISWKSSTQWISINDLDYEQNKHWAIKYY